LGDANRVTGGDRAERDAGTAVLGVADHLPGGDLGGDNVSIVV
jgi:hypothetical protein